MGLSKPERPELGGNCSFKAVIWALDMRVIRPWPCLFEEGVALTGKQIDCLIHDLPATGQLLGCLAISYFGQQEVIFPESMIWDFNGLKIFVFFRCLLVRLLFSIAVKSSFHNSETRVYNFFHIIQCTTSLRAILTLEAQMVFILIIWASRRDCTLRI